MENEQEQQQEQDETKKYLDAIKELRETSVSRQEYDKVREENRTLLQAIVSGETLKDASTDAPQTVDCEKLREDLYGSDKDKLNDYEYLTKTLQLRNELLEKTGVDYFATSSPYVQPSAEALEQAQCFAEAIEHSAEYSQGDNAVFINEMNRLMVDTMRIPVRKK